jgi:hypothetical protein
VLASLGFDVKFLQQKFMDNGNLADESSWLQQRPRAESRGVYESLFWSALLLLLLVGWPCVYLGIDAQTHRLQSF